MATKNNPAFLSAALVLVGGVLFAKEPMDERAKQIMRRGFDNPRIGYEGVMTVTRWYGPHTRSEDVHVMFRPPRSFRREFFEPAGHVRRVVISDGKNEQVRFVDRQRVLVGGAAKRIPKQMRPDAEWSLIEKNYDLFLLGSETICGRPTWVVELSPRTPGKLIQHLWLDKETGVILENKRYRPDGAFVVLSRFTQFHPAPNLDAALFEMIDDKSAEDHQFSPDFLSRDDLKNSTGHEPGLPPSLPFGFEFESADHFVVAGKPVDHLRYTDGVCVLSIFETSKPVRVPRRDAAVNENGSVVHVKANGLHYTIVGEPSQELIRQMFSSFR